MRGGKRRIGDFTILRSRALFVRYLSLLVVHLDLTGGSPPPADLEVLSAFNEYHPGWCPPGVYFYDASEIGLTRASGQGTSEERTVVVRGRKRHEATITIGEFLLSHLSPSSSSASPVFRSLFFSSFFFFHAPRLISPARMTLRGQVVGDSKILPAGSLLVHGMYSA